MKNVLIRTESFLGRYWWILIGLLFIFSFACSSGCQFSRVLPGPDGQPVLVQQGSDIVPGLPEAVEGVTGAETVEDAIGAVVEAAEETNIGGAAQDAATGNWFGLAWKVVAFVVAIGGGFTLRRKLRAKKNAR